MRTTTPEGTPWDHPRSRGVYIGRARASDRAVGSSPLARGLRGPDGLAGLRRRIIPARAGFTAALRRSGALAQDHPRSRGVYVRATASSALVAGSSPLARGLRSPVKARCTGQRIIPARAGFTPVRSPAPRATPDHPRSRGVYDLKAHLGRITGGSSPLARGLLGLDPIAAMEAGIIPARAGFTYPWDDGSLQVVGSSPLARGLRYVGGPAHRPVRIIPARAGFTASPCTAPTGSGDHPRSRGVYVDLAEGPHDISGSSPLARGLRNSPDGRKGGFGIIPARAGFTQGHAARTGPRGDHPRSRGVYCSPAGRPAAHSGSSPLARGLLPRGAVDGAAAGIIPARAGFTGGIQARAK